MTSRLVLRHVEVTLGSFRLVFDGEMHLGCVGLFGPSGAGKTTLLELIAGLRRPDAGSIELDGEILADAPSRRWIPPHCRRIGYVPQDLALFPHLDVRANIRFATPSPGTDADEPAFASLVEILDLAPLLDRHIRGLSGGERQRVALARALFAKPRLLLLDEPLTGLDQDRKNNLLDYLRLLLRRYTLPILYVSHQADEVAALCDDVIVLRDGAFAARGTPAEIFEPSAQPGWQLRRSLCVSREDGHGKEK